MKSRFYFNISITENIKNIFNLFFFKKNNFDSYLKGKMEILFKDSNFYFFDYGRTALYEILSEIKKNTKKKKILVNSLTLFEVINVIKYQGFEPIFIDNQKNSFDTNVDIYKEKNIEDIAALLITHLNGINKNILKVSEQIKNYNLNNDKDKKIYLIEDCAVALGSNIKNQYAGTFGDFSFLSFNIMKNITCYTGGTLIDNTKTIILDKSKNFELTKWHIFKKAIFLLMLQILNLKFIFPIFFKFVRLSHKKSFNFFLKKYRSDFEVKIEKNFPEKFKYNMHNFQKKILYKQFDDIFKKQDDRINKAKIYYKKLLSIKELSFPQKEFDKTNNFLDFPIICKSAEIKRDLFNYLLDNNIDVKNYYYKNCSEEKIYSTTKNYCVNSKEISENIIMLPVHNKIKYFNQELIIKFILSFFSYQK